MMLSDVLRRWLPKRWSTPPGGTKRKRRVLFLHAATQPPLGADTFVQLQIIAALDRTRYEILLACAIGRNGEATPTYAAASAIPEVTIVPIDLGREQNDARGTIAKVAEATRVAQSAVRLLWTVIHHRIAIIHSSDRPRDAATAVVVARLTRRPCVLHAHVGLDPGWMRPLLIRSMRRADVVIGVSDFVCETFAAQGFDRSRLRTARNAVTIERWVPGQNRDATRRALEIGSADVVVITVCRLFPSKGVPLLLEAMALVHREHPNVRVLVVGAEMVPGHLTELHDIAKAGGIGHAVSFLGRRDDVPDLMAASDIFAMPSVGEPFGLVYAEAMAMKRPVVALASGGAPEVIENGQTGLLTPESDVATLAESLSRLIGDPGLRAQMGEAGRRRVEREFTVPRLAADIDRIYGEALERRKHRRPRNRARR